MMRTQPKRASKYLRQPDGTYGAERYTETLRRRSEISTVTGPECTRSICPVESQRIAAGGKEPKVESFKTGGDSPFRIDKTQARDEHADEKGNTTVEALASGSRAA